MWRDLTAVLHPQDETYLVNSNKYRNFLIKTKTLNYRHFLDAPYVALNSNKAYLSDATLGFDTSS